MKPEIALVTGLPPVTVAALEAAFTVHKVHEASDPKAFLAGIADRVRGIATSGGKGADAALMDALPKTEIIGGFGVIGLTNAVGRFDPSNANPSRANIPVRARPVNPPPACQRNSRRVRRQN